jgi:hypothetical protein
MMMMVNLLPSLTACDFDDFFYYLMEAGNHCHVQLSNIYMKALFTLPKQSVDIATT